MDNRELEGVVRAIDDNYCSCEQIDFACPVKRMPDRTLIIDIVKNLRNLMFPNYFASGVPTTSDPCYFVGNTLLQVEEDLGTVVHQAFRFRDGATQTEEQIEEHTEKVVDAFIARLPHIQQMLYKDVQAAFDGDPAAQSKEEVIFSYPGFFAIYVYRFAHELYVQDVPLIPRVMTEYAHSRTGVDINAGATIGEYFFIDHATGVVIGETTIIGDHVKIYQGVTLGALSLRAGQKLKGKKRHPTIEDNVTIYSNASVLGGETTIGEGSVIAGSSFVTESVPKNARVTLENQKVVVNIRTPHPAE